MRQHEIERVSDVKAALATIAGANHARTTIPALQCVRIGEGAIEATDAVGTIRAPLLAAAFDPLLMRVDALRKALGGLRAADVLEMERDGDGLVLTHRLGVTRLAEGAPIVEWPEIPVVGEDAPSIIPADGEAALAEILAVSAHASNDESHPVLRATHLRAAGGVLAIEATDSYRLAMSRVAASHDEVLPLLLPDARRYLAKAGRLDAIRSSGQHVVLDCGGVTVTLRRIEGVFPQSEQLVPASWEGVYRLPSGPELRDGLAYAAKIASTANPVAVHLSGSDSMRVELADEVRWEAEYQVDAVAACDELTIGANPAFLRDGLAFVGGGATLSVNGPLRPMLLEGENQRRYLLIPRRLPA